MHGMDVRLQGVSMRYDGLAAVEPTDLEVKAGEFFSILGPSGCGKTTLLRLIAGFLAPSSGRIQIGGRDMDGIGPNLRPTAMIFQNLALFPLMSVADNVGFGLEARGMARRERRQRAADLLALVSLTDMAARMPHQLSGGERQRVAVARALAVEPAVLLLDEPLSSLDLQLRSHMRAELRAIQRRTGVTFIYITHDQGEALTMSDRIAVMNAGRIEQIDTPDRLYSAPETLFVAGFIGEQNRFEGRVGALSGSEVVVNTAIGPIRGVACGALTICAEAIVLVRPERVGFAEDAGASNRFDGLLDRRTLEGAAITYEFRVGEGSVVMQRPNLGPGSSLLASVHAIGFQTEDALVFPRDGGGRG